MAEIRSRKIDNYNGHSHFHLLWSPEFLRPYRCVGIMQIMHSVSGIITISTYTDTFMEVLRGHIYSLDWWLIFIWQLASAHTGNRISPEYQSIIQGVVMASASLLSPFIFMKFRKRTVYATCTVVASLSMASGKIYTFISSDYQGMILTFFQLLYSITCLAYLQKRREIIWQATYSLFH